MDPKPEPQHDPSTPLNSSEAQSQIHDYEFPQRQQNPSSVQPNADGSVTHPGVMNPAAAAALAALTQLVQFPGTMHQFVSQPPFSGGGARRGGRSFRGGGRENFLGSVQGRGGSGLRFDQSHDTSSSMNGDTPVSGDAVATDEKSDPSVPPQETAKGLLAIYSSASCSAPQLKAPNRPAAQAARCELCSVECNSLEILEQHKNGKKHKKNLLRSCGPNNTEKLGPLAEVKQNPEDDSSQGVALKDGKTNLIAHLPTEGTVEENKMQSLAHGGCSIAEKSTEISDLQAGSPGIDKFGNNGHGMKRKLRGGRGGKRLRTLEASMPQLAEAPKPKVIIPLVCNLCNVKCDTQEVLSKHLAGKKHNSKLKRFQGHQAMYGDMVQALYPPNPITQTLFYPQGHQQDLYGHQSSFPCPPPEAVHSSSNTVYQQYPLPQLSESSLMQNVQNTVTQIPEAQ